MAFASQSEAVWIALVFWHDVNLELLKYWSWPLYGCLKSIAPHSPSQQTEVRNLSILAKSGLGFQNNLSGINCSVGIFRVLGFMDANHLLIKDVIHKVFLIVSLCEFAFRCRLFMWLKLPMDHNIHGLSHNILQCFSCCVWRSIKWSI